MTEILAPGRAPWRDRIWRHLFIHRDSSRAYPANTLAAAAMIPNERIWTSSPPSPSKLNRRARARCRANNGSWSVPKSDHPTIDRARPRVAVIIINVPIRDSPDFRW